MILYFFTVGSSYYEGLAYITIDMQSHLFNESDQRLSQVSLDIVYNT